MTDNRETDQTEPDDAEHGDVPEDLLELFEVMEWESVVAP